ncbi:MAG: ATP-dependent DNA helicase RecG [Candidatus Omnitrophota bacterium]
MPENTPVQYLKGVGPKRSQAFESVGIRTLEDLLYYFPRRYVDRTNFCKISALEEGQSYSVKARVLASRQHRSWRRRGFSITEAVVFDEAAKLTCVWFNQPYIIDSLKPGSVLILYGKTEHYGGRLQFSNPEFELVTEETEEMLNMGRIVPIYKLPEGFSQRTMRQLIKNMLDEFLSKVNDCLPYDLRTRNKLLNLAQSLLNIHFPESLTMQQEACSRLSFEEFFIFQLPLVLRKLKKNRLAGQAHETEGKLTEDFIAGLPFKLTAAQQKVIAEIKADMRIPQPMHRLLQGDVGSGKTVVALIACLMAIQGGYQVAFMAPTEILARQHYNKILSQLAGLKYKGKALNVGLLLGADKEKDKLIQKIKSGKIHLVIGTHALLGEDVGFKDLGLVIIDEQHKFGVSQRAVLPKKGPNPDVLIMTATPIPRTLAITLYGDLDISVINEMPGGRLPVKTMRFTHAENTKAYELAKEQVFQGRQAFVIYPVIEESYALDIAGAKKMFVQLKDGQFRGFRLGLIHGKLKAAEQEEVMRKFENKELDMLISTTILEVGIDIPNATCMIIESAERFGLSQLHQLRGRIGRGKDESACLLISDAKTEEAKARLNAMVQFADGFRIAEEDLKIRGPGEFFGSRQHGLTELKIANPLTQMQLLKAAREEATALLRLDPGLANREHGLLKAKLTARFPEYEQLMLIG